MYNKNIGIELLTSNQNYVKFWDDDIIYALEDMTRIAHFYEKKIGFYNSENIFETEKDLFDFEVIK